MRARPLSFALAAANCAAAALALWPWIAPVGAASAPAARPPTQDDGPPPLATLPPGASYAAIAERPLFSPTRRPDASSAGTLSGISARYRLLGVILAREQGRALVAPIAGGRTLELGEGEAIEGWTVKRIERDRVVLFSPAGEATLEMGEPPR